MGEAIEPFTIRVDDAVLDDLRGRLGADPLPGPDRRHGLGVRHPGRLPARARRLLARRVRLARPGSAAQRARALPHAHRRPVDPLHPRALAHADALPLLLTHGWPGSIVEFLDVIPRLTDPEAHGGRRRRLPRDRAVAAGLRLLRADAHRGWDVPRIARAFIELMGRLGYARYGAQGGDWGAQVTTRIGALDPEHCAAIHLNMPIADPPEEPIPLTEEEQADLAAMAAVPARGVGLRAGAEDETADARRRRSTTPRPGCSRGSSRSSARGATATATPRTCSRATSCSPT